MTWLPRYIAHWGLALRELRDPRWLHLERMAASVGGMLGGDGDQSQGREGVPDGYDGVSHRGTWDRLLLSQWAVAEYLPDEFLRRVADHELSFLRPRRIQEHIEGRCVVIADAGPDQLGTPRIVQLATLLALHRRAMDAGVPFYWGVLTRPGELFEGFGREQVGHFLDARTTDLWTEQHLVAWRASVKPQGSDDLWWLGAPDLSELVAIHESRVTIQEEVYQGEEYVGLVFHNATKDVSRHLPVPNQAICQHLLKNPFGQMTTRASRRVSQRTLPHVLPSALQSMSRFRAIVLESLRTARFDHIPGRPQDKHGRALRFSVPMGERIFAACLQKRRAIALSQDDFVSLSLRQRKLTFPIVTPEHTSLDVPPYGHLLPMCCAGLRPGRIPRVLVIDAARRLWRTTRSTESTTRDRLSDVNLVAQPVGLELVADEVLDMRCSRNAITYLTQSAASEGVTLLQTHQLEHGEDSEDRVLARRRVTGLLSAQLSEWGVVTICQRADHREVVCGTALGVPARVELAANEQVLGLEVAWPRGEEGADEVLVLGGDRRTVWSWSIRHGRQVRFEAPWPVAMIKKAPGSLMMMLSKDGVLAGYDLRNRGFLQV